MSGTYDCMNFTHLTYLMLLHYLVKIETPKLHVNKTSISNVSYIKSH